MVQIAESVIRAVGREDALDAVQLMKTGWYIYTRTALDHSDLVRKGLTVAGNHIVLCSEAGPGQQNTVMTYRARVFKPLALTKCKRCGGDGHGPSNLKCPARMTEEMADMIETFHGQDSPLFNLHSCPEGCEIKDQGTSFLTSEHHYQFKKLKVYDKGGEAYLILAEESGFKAMKRE